MLTRHGPVGDHGQARLAVSSGCCAAGFCGVITSAGFAAFRVEISIDCLMLQR